MLNSGFRPKTDRYLGRRATIEKEYGEGVYDHSWNRLQSVACYLCLRDIGSVLGLAVAVRLDDEEAVETLKPSVEKDETTTDEPVEDEEKTTDEPVEEDETTGDEMYDVTPIEETVEKRKASAFTLHSMNCFAVPSVYFCRSCRNLASTGGSGTTMSGELFTLRSPEERGFTNKFLDRNFSLLTFVENGLRWSITDRLTLIDPVSGAFNESLLLQQLSLMAGNDPGKLQSIRRLTGRFEEKLSEYVLKILVPLVRNLLIACPTNHTEFYHHLDSASQVIHLTIQLILNYPLVKRFLQRTVECWAFNPFNSDGRAAFLHPTDVRLACLFSDYPFEALFQSHRKLLVAEIFDRWDPSRISEFTDLGSISEAMKPSWEESQPLISGDYLAKLLCEKLLEDESLEKMVIRLRYSGGVLDDRLVEPIRFRYQLFVPDDFGGQVKMVFEEMFEQLFPLSSQTETATVQMMKLLLEVKRNIDDWAKIPLDADLPSTLGHQYVTRTSTGKYHVITCGKPERLDRVEKLETDVVHLDYPTPHPIDGRPQLHHRRCLHDGCGETFSGGLDLRTHLMTHKADYKDNHHRSHSQLTITPAALRGQGVKTMRCPSLVCDQSKRMFTVDELIDHFTILGHPNFWRPGIRLPTKTHLCHTIADPEEPEKGFEHHQFSLPPIKEMAECSLCLEQPANMTAFPCGHTFICRDCHQQEVVERGKKKVTMLGRLLNRFQKKAPFRCFFCHEDVERMQTTAVSFSRPTV